MLKVKRPVNWGPLLIAVVVITMLILIAERFITQGTLMGYGVVSKSPKVLISDTSAEESGLCKAIPAEQVSDALGDDVNQLPQNFKDVSEPYFISVCSYRTTKSPHKTVSLVARIYPSSQSLEDQEKDANKLDFKPIDTIGDSSVYSERLRQLKVRKSNTILTITVSEPNTSSVEESKEVSRRLAEKVIDSLSQLK